MRDVVLCMASPFLMGTFTYARVTRSVFDRRQVVCEVISVHWDRVDVKVAVRYPKSYGPRDGKRPKARLDFMDGNEEEDELVVSY